MAKSFLTILLVASSGGNALAFSSSHQSIIGRPIQETSISLSLNSNDDDDSSTNKVQKRRAFLVNFAVLPILTSFANNAYARDDGKLVYGGDDIMSKKEHGTTSSPVQDSLRYEVSFDIIFV